MKGIIRNLISGVFAVAVTGCASGPAFKDTPMTPPQPQLSRIFFYRNSAMGAAVQPDVKLNGQVVGSVIADGFFYVDRVPGNYEVVTSTEATNKLTFTLEKGQARYVRFDMNMGFFVGHVVPRLVDEKTGAKEILETKFADPGPKKG